MGDLEEFRREWQHEVAERQLKTVLEESKNEGHTDKSVRDKRVEAHSSGDADRVDDLDLKVVSAPKRDSVHPEPVHIDGSLTARQKQAIAAFEEAVDHEHVGKLADAIKSYREAYRHDDKVDKLYREKYFKNIKPRQIRLDDISDTQIVEQLKTTTLDDETTNEEEGPLMHLPVELLVEILKITALRDLSGFTRLTYTCKKLGYIGYTTAVIWKALCLKEYPCQHYTEEAIEELGGVWDDEVIGQTLYRSKWRKMYLERPRIWFNGIYISTCNYIRQGAMSETYNAPVHMVTYYRYLRFFEDGTCVSLLTTNEPIEVVPVFNRQIMNRERETPYHYTKDDGTTLQIPKGTLYGTWMITSLDGRILIETEGSVDRFMFYMELDIKSSGKNRHNKLKWRSFKNINKLTQTEGEFNLKHDKAYYFVRTRR